jgi:PhzF family phenazine biosynthesis protein
MTGIPAIPSFAVRMRGKPKQKERMGRMIAAIPYFQVDAFTKRTFSGNPAGVCLLTEWLPDELMQSIAAEHNLAETAFMVRRAAAYDLRWFTPSVEVDLCGHATLAAAHVLFNHFGLLGSSVRFQSRSGPLGVERDESGRLTLDFPAWPAKPCEAPAALLKGLGATPTFVAKNRDFLAVFDSVDDVRRLRPDMRSLESLDALGVIATAPGTDCDFVSRFFAPSAGVPEDPVTGSAHCTLTHYWADRLKKPRLTARQISQRGGELECELKSDRVAISGRAVTYLTGFIQLPR